jgi:hypothetical protein
MAVRIEKRPDPELEQSHDGCVVSAAESAGPDEDARQPEEGTPHPLADLAGKYEGEAWEAVRAAIQRNRRRSTSTGDRTE